MREIVIHNCADVAEHVKQLNDDAVTEKKDTSTAAAAALAGIVVVNVFLLLKLSYLRKHFTCF